MSTTPPPPNNENTETRQISIANAKIAIEELLFKDEPNIIGNNNNEQHQNNTTATENTTDSTTDTQGTINAANNIYEDFSNFSNDEISDCGDDNDEIYEASSEELAVVSADDEYDEYQVNDDDEESETIDDLDSDDDEFMVGSRKSKKRTSSKSGKKSKKTTPKTTSTKRNISSAFGKSRRPLIQFKKKKKSSTYGEVDYGDTTTEEEFSIEEEYDENDYFYKYEQVGEGDDADNHLAIQGETCSVTKKKLDINQFGTETKYNDAAYYSMSNKLAIDKVFNYRFGSTSSIGNKIYRFRPSSSFQVEEEGQNDDKCDVGDRSLVSLVDDITLKSEQQHPVEAITLNSEQHPNEGITLKSEQRIEDIDVLDVKNELIQSAPKNVPPGEDINIKSEIIPSPPKNIPPIEDIEDDVHQNVMQFLIKWKDKSYLHCSWESEQSLAELGVTNTKKLQNYCQDNNITASCSADPMSLMDEHSQSMLNDKNQKIDDALEEFTNLECILAITPSSVALEQYSLYESTSEYNLDELLSEGVNFLCHWNNLPCSDATWEDSSLIYELFPDAIREYFIKKAKMYYQLDLRRMGNLKFYKVDSTPDFISHCNCQSDANEDGGVGKVTTTKVEDKTQSPLQLHSTCNILRDYQLEGINWLTSSFCRKKSVILADEMGLGKTVQVISFISTLYHTYHINGPYLIVVPLSTIESWKTHFQKWAPELIVISYTGNAESRKVMRKYNMFDNDTDDNEDVFEKLRSNQTATNDSSQGTAASQEFNIYNFQVKFHVLVTTYEMIIKDKEFIGQFDWVSLIVDEAHRLKNVESSLYVTLKSFYSSHRLLMTGTPLQNNLRELWSILYFILSDRYPSWEEFEMDFSQVDPKSGYVKLQKEISPYILRRMKKDVEKSLPPKIEQILRVEMTKKQKDLYKCILTKNYTQLSKELKCNVTGFLNVMMELKKCCNHTSLITHHLDLADCTLPDILRGGGKLILLNKLLERFKKDGSRVLIFSQMIMILDILSAYLTLKGYSFQRLDGSVGEAKRKQAMNEFNAVGSKNFCFLLSTRAGGLGINLVSADVVIIFDSDWNPQNDLQAQARAHRIGQTKTVKIYRLVTKSSVDETIVERAKKKMVLDHLVIQTMNGIGGNFTSGNYNQKSSNSMASYLDKKDLSSIIKFGAEELFKEGDDDNDDDKLEEMDIDQILLLAEEHDSDQQQQQQQHLNSNTTNASEDLLSSFKVANFKTSDFDMGEDESSSESDEAGLKWDDIIPENERRRILDEEETARMAQLYLPPRRRTTVSMIDPYNIPISNKSSASSKKSTSTKSSTSNTKKKHQQPHHHNKRRRSVVGDSSEDDIYHNISSDEKKRLSTTNSQSRKKGKLAQFINEFNGLNGKDIKKFVASYKKFPLAWERCEVVARDANLTNKPIKQVQQLAKWIHSILPKANPKVAAVVVASIKSKAIRSNKLTINDVQLSSAELYEWEQLTKPIGQHIKSHIVDKSPDFSNVKVVNVTFELFRELYPSFGVCFKYCKFTKFSIDGSSKINWKPKHDAELIIGVFFMGFSNWQEMFDVGLLTILKESDMATSVVSKKMKKRLHDLIDVISKAKFSSCVDYSSDVDDDAITTNGEKMLDDELLLDSDDDDAFVHSQTHIKSSKKKINKSLLPSSSSSSSKSVTTKKNDSKKLSLTKPSKTKKSSVNSENEKSTSKRVVVNKDNKKHANTSLITQYMKPPSSSSKKDYSNVVVVVESASKHDRDREKIIEINLTDKMVDCCGLLLKPVKERISNLESIFKGRIFDEVTNSPDFSTNVEAIGHCIDSSYEKNKLTSKNSKIFKNIHHMKCAMWNFVSRFTNATPLELYTFYFDSV